MAYNAEAQKRYNAKGAVFAVKYTPAEKPEADKLKAYLAYKGTTANAYIKALIRADLLKWDPNTPAEGSQADHI